MLDKPIPGFPGYSIDLRGNVFSTHERVNHYKIDWMPEGKHEIKHQINVSDPLRWGYAYVSLHKNGKRYRKRVAELLVLVWNSSRMLYTERLERRAQASQVRAWFTRARLWKKTHQGMLSDELRASMPLPRAVRERHRNDKDLGLLLFGEPDEA